MKITRVYNRNFQRNGIDGSPFYSCFIDWVDGKIEGKEFLMTFEVREDIKTGKEYVDVPLCRVVDIKNPLFSWRGDEFGRALTSFFKEKGITEIYMYF